MPCQENFRVNLLLFSFSAGLRNTVDVHWLRLNMDNINNSNEIPDYIDYKRWEWFHWIAVKNVHMPYCLWTCRYCVQPKLQSIIYIKTMHLVYLAWLLITVIINDCKYMKIIYVNSDWRNEYGNDPCSYEHYLSSSKNKAWKNSSLYWIWTHDLCNTGVVLYQLSKQANWDLVIMLVPNKPSNWWINNCNYVKITYVNVRLKKRMWKPSWQLWTLLR